MREGRRTPSWGRRGRRAARLLLVPLVASAAGCLVEATWEPREVEPVGEAVPDRFQLTDVACPEEGACVAVGGLGTAPNQSVPLVLRQDGDGWARVPFPLDVPSVHSVSCTAPDDCLVAGRLDLAYRGGELSLIPQPPLERGWHDAVDCAPGGGCLRTDGLSSSWWDGTAWSPAVPLPAGMMRETPQLSCTSATSCLLVATDFGIEGWPTPGRVTSTTWDGDSWSPVVALDHDTRPFDLDCATATACIATAGVRHDYWTGPLGPVPAEVLRWDGTAWTVEAIAYPGGVAPTEPGTVSCASATSCTVLSVAGTGTPPSPTLVARWDGTAWTGAATDAASPATALACTAPADCVSTGTDVAQRWDGTTWADTALPGGTSPAEVLTAVSCATEEDCVAVGAAWELRTPSQGPLLTPSLHRRAGGDWAAEDAGGDELRHASCATASSCMVAGGDFGSFHSRHWDGTAWRALPPVADQRVAGVTGLSCAAADWCLLTTTRYLGGESDTTWLWTGGDTWAPATALPAGAGIGWGLSCPAVGECVTLTDDLVPQAYRLSGGAWSAIDLAPAGLEALDQWEDVACTAPGECAFAASGWVDGRPAGTLAVLSGGAWEVTERDGNAPIDVDCWSAAGCVAVMGGLAPHLQAWDGGGWRAVEGPPGIARPTAVSCGGPARCEVVGAFADGSSRAAAAAVSLSP